jgi:hypothetical protein
LKKTLSLTIIFLLILANLFADFRDDEKPVWGMLNDTAYTLKAGEWNIDLWGPVTYGIFDNFQLGTLFWLWFAQMPNFNGKINIIPETDAMPAFSVGGSYAQFSFTIEKTNEITGNKEKSNVTLKWYQIGGYLTKQLSEKLYLSGAYIYNGVDASASLSTNDSPVLNITGTGNASKALLDLIIETAKNARVSLEGVANIGNKVEFDAGAGVEWAMGDVFRLKLGIYTALRDNLFYIPFVDLHWRFK